MSSIVKAVVCRKQRSRFSSYRIFFILLFSCIPPAFTQENYWHEPFFIEGAALYYATPEFFSEMIEPKIGFRAALGYEFRRFRFAVESGYTRITGTNPFVLDLRFFPLAFKFGYSLPIYKGLGLQADLNCGVLFSQTVHYQDAIDLILEKKKETPANSPLAGARLYGTWTIPYTSVKLYAGGGVDAVFETDGIIPLPAIEAGISVKPFALFRPKERQRETEVVETEDSEEEVPAAEYPETEKPAKITVARMAIYFRADSAAIIEEYRPVLDEAGRRLRENPALRITLRGYTAPSGTEEGQTTLSAARSWYCVEYLMRYYGIAEERMNIEFYGAEETPGQESGQNAWEYRRRVDLIIEQGAD